MGILSDLGTALGNKLRESNEAWHRGYEDERERILPRLVTDQEVIDEARRLKRASYNSSEKFGRAKAVREELIARGLVRDKEEDE